MERFEFKTKFPVTLDSSRLHSSVLKNSTAAVSEPATSTYSFKSPLLAGLLEKHQDLIKSSRVQSSLNTNLTTSSLYPPSKRGGFSNKGAPPIKKVKTIKTVSKPQKPALVVKGFVGKSSMKRVDQEQELGLQSAADDDFVETDKLFSEVNYGECFEKMQVDEDWECDFGLELEDISTDQDFLLANKKNLLNLVNISLVESPNFKKINCNFRGNLILFADQVAEGDPEFILKVSLYSRQHLNIRTTSNFLVAYAATHKDCKRYLSKYYSSIVLLPSDWIEIAEFALTFCKDGQLVFPSSLRRVMVSKFAEFDKYQLGKYNKDKTKSKKKREKKKTSKSTTSGTSMVPDKGCQMKQRKGKLPQREASNVEDWSEDKREFNVPQFTIKQLIRKLHISDPVDHVMSLVGKKYPSSMEEFFHSRLPGLFEEERAGKRMKLPVPETWETQVSLKGNKAKVWEELIDKKKLPFMAMLRNLRNLIIANISAKHHNWVRSRLTNEYSVINSRQFPFRFFSAYVELNKLLTENSGLKTKFIKKPKGSTKSTTLIKRSKKNLPKNLTTMISEYRSALDKAVMIATKYNIPPMPGRSIIFCDLSDPDVNSKNCSSARGFGDCKTVGKMAVLLSLMCKHSCEEGRLFICGRRSMEEVGLISSGTILKNTEDVLKLETLLNDSNDGTEDLSENNSFDYINIFIENLIYNKEKIDRWIVMGGRESKLTSILSDRLEEYKWSVNPSILGFQVNLASPPSQSLLSHFSDDQEKEGFIQLFGLTEQVLRFMVERGDSGQITFVENIDKLHRLEDSKHLKEIKESKPHLPDLINQPAPKLPKWSNCRIFISSTFLDMFSERDLLVKYIFQELKARARSLHVNIFEVDLRWGISEEQTQNNETVYLCLSEVMKCQFFVGMLGERYGWCPKDYGDLSQYPGVEWIDHHPKGASLTELEFHQCFRSLDARKRAFFYFRDPQFLKDVPKKYKNLVMDGNEQKLKNLKRFVINSGAEVFNNYPCCWGGIDDDGKARVVDLENFGRRVLDNLWNAIQQTYLQNKHEDDDWDTVDGNERHLHLSYVDFLNSRFAGRQNVINSVIDLIRSRKTGLILLTGKPGSGKSAIMASVCKHWMDLCEGTRILVHCVGASPGSDNIVRTLYRLIAEMGAVPMPPAYWETGTFDMACKLFHESLKILSSQNISVQIFIDGVDYLSNDHHARLMTWLPLNIPQNVLLIVSTSENSISHNALKSRSYLVGTIDIGLLSLLDKQAIIRETLKSYSKTLDESAFNNQMKLITTKRESSSPLYLSIICEEMRQFGDFDRVNTKLATLPSTLAKLMQDMIENLEKSHGVVFVRTALCCLAYSKDGLKECELQEILSRAVAIEWTEVERFQDISDYLITPEDMVSPSSVLFFIRSAQSLLRPNAAQGGREVLLSVGHGGVKEAIRQRYTSTPEGKKYEKFIHLLLAAYFYNCVDPNLDKNWKSVEKRVLSSLTHHLVQFQDYQTLFTLLTDLSFIEFGFLLNVSKELLEAYQLPAPSNVILKKDYEHLILSKKFKDYQTFVFKNAHLLIRYPQLTIQQALLEAGDSQVWSDSSEVVATRHSFRSPYARWLNKEHHQDFCMQSVPAQGSSCLALSSDDKLLAVGFESAVIKLYKTADYEITSTLIGHSGSVTSICFVSTSRLCSSSKDGTLSLWDISGGYRLAVMEGHKRAVTSCTSDHVGRIVVSVGLDATTFVWHGVTGALEATLPRDSRPINCLSLHPEGQLVVTGSWDSNLKIWDIVQKEKKVTLKGHSGSVQEVQFNRSGLHIASVDIFGEVRIWSAQHGCVVGFIRSQPDLTTKVFYSGNELLLSSISGTVKVLSSTLGRCTNTFGESSHGPAVCLAFDPSPETPLPNLVVGYHSGSVRMFSCTSGNQVWDHVHQGPPVAISSIAFHWTGDRKYIAAGKADGTCELVAAENSKNLGTLSGHSSAVSSIAWSKKFVITAGGYHLNVHKTGDVIELCVGNVHKPDFSIEKHKDVITGISLSHSGDMLASVARDRTIIIWKVEGSLEAMQEINEAHKDWITCCCWSNSSDILATGSNDFTVKIWDAPNGTIKHTLTGHDSMVTGVSFKHGCIISSSTDGCLKVWSHKGIYISSLMASQIKCNSCDLFTKVEESEESKENVSSAMSWEDKVVLEQAKGSLADQRTKIKAVIAASCYDDGTVRIWSPNEADEKYLLIGHKKDVVAVTSSNHGLVISSSNDGFLKAWKIPMNQKHAKSLKSEISSAISCLATSPDGKIICASTKNGTIKMWLESDVVRSTDAICHPKCSIQVSFSQITCLRFVYNDLFAFASSDHDLSIWQVQSRKNDLSLSCLQKITCDHPITSMASMKSHQESLFLVTVHFQGFVRLWKILNDKKADVQKLFETKLDCLQFFGAHILSDSTGFWSYLSVHKKFQIYKIDFCDSSGLNRPQSKFGVESANIYIYSPMASSFTHDPHEGLIYHGTLNGYLYIWKGSYSQDGLSDSSKSSHCTEHKLHRDKITGLVLVDGILFTSSLDGCVKVFDTKNLKVVGEFSTQFKITSMIELQDQAGPPCTYSMLCGTESGVLLCIQWNVNSLSIQEC